MVEVANPFILYAPFTVDETSLTATNLVETATEWAVGTTYAAGAEVYVTATKTVYVSAVDGNLGNDPATSDETIWIIRAAMNKWAAFDAFVANKAIGVGDITYTITVDEVTTGISFFGLVADSLTVTVAKGAYTRTYDVDLSTYDHINGSLWNWFTGGRPRLSDYSIRDLVYYGAGTTISITIGLTGGNAQVGQIVLGDEQALGGLSLGASLRLQLFTRYVEDQFGNLLTIKRTPAVLPELDIAVRNGNVRRTQQILSDLEGRATVFVAAENPLNALNIFGVLVDFEILIETKDFHRVKLKIRGLL